MNEQQQTVFTFLDVLNVSWGFKIKTKNQKTVVSVDGDKLKLTLTTVIRSISDALKKHPTVTVVSVDFSDPKVFTVTFTCKT